MPSFEILIKGQDLISVNGYFQSNRGRWRTSGWPTTPTGWQWLGAADAAGADRSSALHGYGALFSMVSPLTEPVECEELTKGVFYWWGLQSRMCSGKVQASTFADGGEMLQGSAHDKVWPNGCGAERRTPALDRWSSRSVTRGMAMKGVSLGFVLVFFKILAQLPYIYRGFGLTISCAYRALSPSLTNRPVSLSFRSVVFPSQW
jgi:hypothetical protein